jgi:hypothetical protein
LIEAGLTVLAALVETGGSPHSAAATGAFLAVLTECFRWLRRDRRKLVFIAPSIICCS